MIAQALYDILKGSSLDVIGVEVGIRNDPNTWRAYAWDTLPTPQQEAQAAALISAWCESSIPAQREHGQLLDRVRQGRGPRTLLDPRGGWAGGCNARAYAVACLTLAVSLGDEVAAVGLGSLRKAD